MGLKQEKAVKSAYVRSEFSTSVKMNLYISVSEFFFYPMVLHNLDNYFMPNEELAGCVFFG